MSPGIRLLQKGANCRGRRLPRCVVQCRTQCGKRHTNPFPQRVELRKPLLIFLRKRIRKTVRQVFPFLQPTRAVNSPHEGVIFERSNFFGGKPEQTRLQAAEQAVPFHAAADRFQSRKHKGHQWRIVHRTRHVHKIRNSVLLQYLIQNTGIILFLAHHNGKIPAAVFSRANQTQDRPCDPLRFLVSVYRRGEHHAAVRLLRFGFA